VFPSSSDANRDPWGDDLRDGPPARRGRDRVPPGREPADRRPLERGPHPGERLDRPGAGPAGGVATRPRRTGAGPPTGELRAVPRVPVVPVRRLLSLAIAGFAGLLGIGLIFGAQTAGVGTARIPYAVVIFGVQLMFVLAWAMAMRPPALPVVAGVGILAAAAADIAAIKPAIASLAPLGYVAVGGVVVAVLGQMFRRTDRIRVTESLGATLVLLIGVVSFATLIVLTRIEFGTQAIFVALSATAVAIVVARLADTVAPMPRLAPQVPRGAFGVVLGAMCGTLTGAVIGSYVYGLTPTKGAIVGVVAAGAAAMADLGVGYAEAGRQMAGDPPTMWVARHMQGPLGGFALAAPVAYAMSVLFLVPHA
jgi:hypothetical protein